MNLSWPFYRLDTGEFTGRRFSGPEDAVELNTPVGCGAVEGRHDKSVQRMDLESGLAVQREQPQEEVERELRDRRAAAARTQIRELEQRQARRVRELLAESDPMLREIDEQIQALRAEITTP
jgi:hypothetical protein